MVMEEFRRFFFFSSESEVRKYNFWLDFFYIYTSRDLHSIPLLMFDN